MDRMSVAVGGSFPFHGRAIIGGRIVAIRSRTFRLSAFKNAWLISNAHMFQTMFTASVIAIRTHRRLAAGDLAISALVRGTRPPRAHKRPLYRSTGFLFTIIVENTLGMCRYRGSLNSISSIAGVAFPCGVCRSVISFSMASRELWRLGRDHRRYSRGIKAAQDLSAHCFR